MIDFEKCIVDSDQSKYFYYPSIENILLLNSYTPFIQIMFGIRGGTETQKKNQIEIGIEIEIRIQISRSESKFRFHPWIGMES